MTLRAFYGYGSLCNLQGLPVEIVRGSVVNDNRDVDGKLCIPVKGRYLICEEWRIPFRKIELRDKERMEAIRRKYQPMLSDWLGVASGSIFYADTMHVETVCLLSKKCPV